MMVAFKMFCFNAFLHNKDDTFSRAGATKVCVLTLVAEAWLFNFVSFFLSKFMIVHLF